MSKDITYTYSYSYPNLIATGCFKGGKIPEKKFGGAFDIIRHFGVQTGYTTAKIVKVIYNDPATIVFWNDGTKTVAKAHDGDVYNPEMGLTLCVLKKVVKPEAVMKLFNDWLPEEGNIVTMKDVRRRHKNE